MSERTNLSERANELLRGAASSEQGIEAIRVARSLDGASAPSTLDAVVYTAPDRPKKCEQDGRPAKFFEGCSVLECPMRKPITAQPSEATR